MSVPNPKPVFKPGCYFDGARGVHLIEALAHFAESYGFDCSFEDNPDVPENLSEYEFAGEVEDEIDNYFNENFPMFAHTWGRNENGDWGLWADPVEGDNDENSSQTTSAN